MQTNKVLYAMDRDIHAITDHAKITDDSEVLYKALRAQEKISKEGIILAIPIKVPERRMATQAE